ncbi:hypothetical protein MNBD_GAMMA16-1818 [hydrothermal vent metagenome]|uniref:Type II secretion system protein GspC N-terminal domain-containing protein n=1 Tax=hydrothermal vent metagenome TaxID=652676 RepID=A0A3B0ZGU5_9ZZZZ
MNATDFILVFSGGGLEKIALFLGQISQPTYMEKAARLASLGLFLAVMFYLSKLVWFMVPEPEHLPYTPLSVTHVSSAERDSQVASIDVAALNLFGQPGVVKRTPQAQPEKIMDTNLKLTLRGILASDDATIARAIIADDRSRKENLYRIGGKISGGAELKEVNVDHIVLSRNGRLEILRLPKSKISGGSSLVKQPRQSSSASANRNRRLDSNASLREVRDSLMKDPQSLATLMTAEPQVDADGKVTGFKLGRGQDARMLRRFGLRRGDIVTSVNGVKLDGMNKLPELMKVLPSAQELSIEYTRRGQSRSVVLNMDG